MILSFCLSAVVVASGAAGAPEPAAASTLAAAQTTAATRADRPRGDTDATCAPLPPIPARPSRTRSVADFGARPNDDGDDTESIQRALDSLAPGEWLVFPPGRYLQSKSLKVKVRDAVLWGDGATLHATNPGDQAIWIEADGASVYKFTLTAVTDKRRTAPWESRIAVFGGARPGRVLTGNVIRGNRIVEAGEPGTPLANSASSAAIFVYRGNRFLVADNFVSRSLADGIHVTAGSSYGRVLNNKVRETGDDMIAVVSYVGDRETTAGALAANLDERRERSLVHHVRIADNDVSGQYWGRGISVVGGENVTIEGNRIDRTVHGAAIYIARETSYLTFGVRDVLVRNNTITDVQTTEPAYSSREIGPKPPKTGHGAVEVYSWLYDDEADIPALRDALGVRDVRIESNTISRARADGMRIGNGPGPMRRVAIQRKDGSKTSRGVTDGPVSRIDLKGNRISGVGAKAIAINKDPGEGLDIACDANALEGRPATDRLCGSRRATVTGACGS